jgi:hypothetical protein
VSPIHKGEEGRADVRVKPKVVETAAERRRKAIMAALEPNTLNASSGSSSSTVKARPKPVAMTSMMVGGQRVAVPRKEGHRDRDKEIVLVVSDDEEEEEVVLPRIPKDLPSRKRQLPWEEDVG